MVASDVLSILPFYVFMKYIFRVCYYLIFLHFVIRIFDEERQQRAGHLYEYSFSEHALPVTDIVTGYGGSNAIIVSASQDRTCKVYIP